LVVSIILFGHAVAAMANPSLCAPAERHVVFQHIIPKNIYLLSPAASILPPS
jgi:hypothetical protein